MFNVKVWTVILIAVLMTALGCSNDNQATEETGTLELSLELPEGSNIHTVHYAITGNGISLEDDIAVTGAVTVVKALVGGIPAGTDYNIELTATADDGATCVGSAVFSIVAELPTFVSILLQCTEVEQNGALIINATFNICPVITSVTVLPTETTVGFDIALTSTNLDGDGDVVTSDWSATEGTFSDTTTEDTTYTCTLAGNHLITLVVDDGNGCTDDVPLPITCLPAGACGDGTVQLGDGETCDDGNNTDCDGCSATCQTEGCGNSVVECGEECDDGNLVIGDGCDDACLDEGCGNGTVDFGETCDDGNDVACDGCSATCQVEECGNGVQECTEECDDGNLDVGDGCDASCVLEPTTACALIYSLDIGGPGDYPAPDDDAISFTGCNTRVRDTLGAAGDLTAGIGGGTLVLVVPSDGGQNVDPAGGAAQVFYYELDKSFQTTIPGLLTITNTVTDSAGDGTAPVAFGNLAMGATPTVTWAPCDFPAGYDDNIPQSVSNPLDIPGDFLGSYSPDVVGTGAGCLAPYRSIGNVNCDGAAAFCGQGGLLVGDNAVDLTWEQKLETLTFSADLSTFSMPFAQTPNYQPARTYMNWGGTLTGPPVCQ